MKEERAHRAIQAVWRPSTPTTCNKEGKVHGIDDASMQAPCHMQASCQQAMQARIMPQPSIHAGCMPICNSRAMVGDANRMPMVPSCIYHANNAAMRRSCHRWIVWGARGCTGGMHSYALRINIFRHKSERAALTSVQRCSHSASTTVVRTVTCTWGQHENSWKIN